MKKLFLVLPLALCAFAQATSVYALGTMAATGTTVPVRLLQVAHKHTLQVAVTGAPTGCSIQLEGTLDDSERVSSPTWANLSGAQTCTSSVTFHVTDRPVVSIRANLTALSGGTSPTVTVKYVGVQ